MRLILSCVVVFASCFAIGEAEVPREPSDSSTFPPIRDPYLLADSAIVTANRFGESRRNTIWPAVQVNQRKLAASSSLAGALDGVAGLDIRQSAGIGSLATLSNWGAFNRHLLLLTNGRPVRDIAIGGFNLSDYSSTEFEQAELVKGPQSSWFGSDAVGGVVNLISPSLTTSQLRALAGLGSFDERRFALDGVLASKPYSLGFFAEHQAADNERDNSGVKRLILGVRAEQQSGGGKHTLRLHARYFSDSIGVPGPVPDQNAIPLYGNESASATRDFQLDDNVSIDAGYRYLMSEASELDVSLFYERKELTFRSLYGFQFSDIVPPDTNLTDFITDSYFLSRYDKRATGLSVRLLANESDASFRTGIDLYRSSLYGTLDDTSVTTTASGPETGQSSLWQSTNIWNRAQTQYELWGAYAVAVNSLVRFDLSARGQFIPDRKTQPSANAGIRVRLSPAVSGKFAYGYSFRLPSLSDQFAAEPYVSGNPLLSPEKSHTYSFGLDYAPSAVSADVAVTVFYQRMFDLIQYQFDAVRFVSSPINIDRFRSLGLDISARGRVGQLVQLEAGAVLQHAEQTVAQRSGLVRANYVPRLKGRLSVGSPAGSRLEWSTTLVSTSSRRLIMSDNSEKLIGSVVELSATIGWRVSSLLSLQLHGEDLTDQARADQFGYTSSDHDFPGLGARFSAKVIATLR